MSDPVERITKYCDDYDDAPSWGGPTMYPAAPSVADLRVLLTRLERLQAPTPPTDGIEERARELLAAELDAVGTDYTRRTASAIRGGANRDAVDICALRAIAAALATPQPACAKVDREAVARIILSRTLGASAVLDSAPQEWRDHTLATADAILALIGGAKS